MTKLASKIATGLAVLALAAPAFAVTQSTTTPSGSAQTSAPSKAHRAHKKVAQADTAKSGATKSDSASATKSDTAAKSDAKATTKSKSAKKHSHSKKSQEKAPAASESPATSAPAPAPAK